MTRPLRIGAIPFLNVQPLIWGLEKAHVLVPLLPSASPEALTKGQVDVAIAPLAAHLQHPQWPIVPVAAIASKGPVQSVRLLHRSSLNEVTRLWADADSLNSVLLSRLILRRWHRVEELEVLTVGTASFNPAEVEERDAVLQIGDKALSPVPDGFQMTDLGEKWFRHTGLPFVYAVWTARDEASAREAAPILWAAKEAGLKHIDEIAERYPGLRVFGVANMKKYLRENLRFELGAEEQKAIQIYARYLREEGLLRP
jgi:chorismate dehydratase